jgi:signal peptidase II
VVFFRYFSPVSTMGILAFALVLGGAVGNLTDRIRHGFVIDFISVQLIRWPPFNVADTAITVGIVGLIYYLYTSGAFRRAYERGHSFTD